MMLPPFVAETEAGIAAFMVVLGTFGFITTCPYGFEFEFVGVVMINLCIRDMQYNYIF